MSARQTAGTAADRATTARTIPSSSAVLKVVVRVAGDIPVRLDLTHAGTREQQLGMSLGTVLIYLRSATTARAVAEGWRTTAMLARPLSPILTGRRPLQPGPSTAGVLVRLAACPRCTRRSSPPSAAAPFPRSCASRSAPSPGRSRTRTPTPHSREPGAAPPHCSRTTPKAASR